jgi:hypothetical protein
MVNNRRKLDRQLGQSRAPQDLVDIAGRNRGKCRDRRAHHNKRTFVRKALVRGNDRNARIRPEDKHAPVHVGIASNVGIIGDERRANSLGCRFGQRRFNVGTAPALDTDQCFAGDRAVSGSGVLSSSWSLLYRGRILPAVRQKFHLAPYAKIRDHLCEHAARERPKCHGGCRTSLLRDLRRSRLSCLEQARRRMSGLFA